VGFEPGAQEVRKESFSSRRVEKEVRKEMGKKTLFVSDMDDEKGFFVIREFFREGGAGLTGRPALGCLAVGSHLLEYKYKPEKEL
jgi:hypothetical protein